MKLLVQNEIRHYRHIHGVAFRERCLRCNVEKATDELRFACQFFEVYHLARVGEREAIPSDEIRSTNFIRVVANRIGAERILGVNASEADEKEAAKLILDNLELTPVNSEIWKVEFRHRDPEVCKQVLEDILASYYRPYFKDGIGPSMTIIEAPTEPKRMP